jgi:hypothetical protein
MSDDPLAKLRRRVPPAGARPATVPTLTASEPDAVTVPALPVTSDEGQEPSRPTLGSRYRAAASAAATMELALAALLVVQITWLGVLYHRSWFFGDDFSFLRFAQHQPLSWTYLTTPFNVHLAPGLRLIYWLLAHLGGLDWTLAVAGRLVIEAATTLLLYRLLIVLNASRWGAYAVTAVYAFSSLTVPSTAYLGNATNQVPSQLALVLAGLCWVRYCRSRDLLAAAGTGLALFVAVCFWEKSAIDGAALLLLLSLWLANTGTINRVRRLIHDLPGLGLAFVPMAVFFGYFVSHHYGQSSFPTGIAPRSAVSLIWTQWTKALWLGAAGGPWRWVSLGGVPDAVAQPPTWGVVVGQVLFVGLVVAGWIRNRWVSLLPWLILAAALVSGELLVANGRFAGLGVITALDYHYGADLLVLLAVATGLACCTNRLSSDLAGSNRHTWAAARQAWTPMATTGLVVVLAFSGAFSGWRWTTIFATSPAKSYETQLVAAVHALPPDKGLFDVPMPISIQTFLEPYRRVSDMLGDAEVSAHIDSGLGTPRLPLPDGRIVPATFFVAGRTAPLPTRTPICPRLIQGQGSTTFPIREKLGLGYYFVKVGYFQQRPTTLTVQVDDAHEEPIQVQGPDSVGAGSTLANQYVALQLGQPAFVTVKSSSPATNICLTSLSVGYPVAANP